jgi:hypothetical protein
MGEENLHLCLNKPERISTLLFAFPTEKLSLPSSSALSALSAVYHTILYTTKVTQK